MTARADAAPERATARPPPRARGAAATPGFAVPGLVGRLLAILGRASNARTPNAADLTDRQLADVGLARSDLPDHRGWRR